MNIVITGASSGVGRETVKILAGIPGNRLIVIARNGMKIQALSGECNIKRQETVVQPLQFDLATGDMESLAHQINRQLGKVDILINNAGAMLNKPLGMITAPEIEEVFSVNVKAPMLLIQALLPLMKPGSHIVNIGSMGGVQGSVKFPGLSAYSASKGALAVLTECLAEELKDRQIAVNCLAFGAVQTEMLAKAFPGYEAPVSAGKMAEFVADFALNGNRYFNGKILPVSLSTP
ncbi:SDR family oxidoreductase [Lentimicrobium sp.]|jgi:NAD(P)-dependent dehydrogenase (short-subunit alcohol dehydrogenase family)|uniref:SDR family NAD(P)-dependent oxidoreductase n=1 Tax=Lentimicrobium sp. TaxID=2034841 RepID=UPI0025D3E8DF|nr:SDR family oxidoreductase [Lentimicrobium sp.]MCO5255511.1 SDR family oxidoreductase [Lentimicrobium sp.]MCO5261791.1 SDR family oxidoreductase [Lentimicrobium sp.]HPF63971.1 SDR family oxidoreductase [Lentimicrobium sp.]HPJ63710.1 SDR family oxidoreductase [Lentimicrobium sp.]HPR25535.1 SDR family oxidoreductase [Lentimicrobium sp.]